MRNHSTSLPPNPSLVAILLVTDTGAGPRLVFHYPAVPSSSPYHAKRDPAWYGTPGTATEESGDDSDEWDSSSSDSTAGSEGDDEASSRAGSGTGSRGSKVRSGRTKSTRDGMLNSELDEETIESNDRVDGENGLKNGLKRRDQQDQPEWENLLGFSAAGLSALLTPDRCFNKRRFELCIEQFVFVGAPMFQREDGFWKKRRRHRKKESVDISGTSREDHAPDGVHIDASESQQDNDSGFEESNTARDQDLRNVPGFDAGYGHSGSPSELGSDVNSAANDQREMKMFNVVCVMNPSFLEHHIRVEEMYDFIIKRFAKALKYEQAQSNYVAQEASNIMSLKDKAKESKAPISTLWANILGTSTLAKAFAVVFDTISSNKIAHVDLNGFDTSFQITQAISTPFVPTPTEPQMPGLWLTTATLIDDEDLDASLSPHAALLLLEDDETLLKEIESDGKELSGPLSFFIRNLTPTKSLLKLSQRHSMPLKDVQVLARHLIYWRRARAIPPLHWRDIYIVSPNADMHALSAAIPAFAARFPTLQPLPKILHALSGPPRQYSKLMPSLDHRTAYMEILAWLMRGGWVTQLRSFAWIRVSREVKAAVAAKQNRESRHSIVTAVNVEHAPEDPTTALHTRENLQTSSTATPLFQRSPEGKTSATSESGQAHASPLLSPFRYPTGPPSDAGSTSSSRTAIQSSISALSPLQRPDSRTLHRPSPLHINQSASPSSAEDNTPSSPSTAHRGSTSSSSQRRDTNHSAATHNGTGHMIDSVNIKSENPADYEPSIVHSPQRASNEESAWIEHIGESVPDLFQGVAGSHANASGTATPDVEAGELWPVMLKYFDGRYALEEISAREGLKKKKVREFLGRLAREGVLIVVRHW